MNDVKPSTPFRSRNSVNPLFQYALKAFRKPGRLLDLGCNTGTDIIHAAKYGWIAEGCDIDTAAIAFAKQSFAEQNLTNVAVHPVSIQDFLKQTTSAFDMVAAIDVLSFIPPNDMLYIYKRIGEIVKPGGLVVLRVFTTLECIVTRRPDRTFFDQCDLECGFPKFSILLDQWEVFNDRGHVGRPEFHQHHVEVFIARKQ